MASKLITLLSLIAFAGVCAINAQSPAPSTSPGASSSPAKHRKKVGTSPSPVAENSASPSPSKARSHKKAEASPSSSPANTAAPSPAEHRTRKKAAAASSATPAASATPGNPISAIGSLFKPKTSPTPGTTTKASTAATNATPAPGGGHGLVWVNTDSHVYHKEGSRFYGKTKKGKYTTEADAQKEGDREAKQGE
jgi:hypothetical protein